MICPKCKKPYFFIDKKNTAVSSCLRCDNFENFKQPEYLNYHEDLYTVKKYTRNIQTDPQMKQIIKSLDINPADTILDIGCGVGDYTKEIHNLTKKVIGLDISVKAAKNKYPDVYFTDCDCNASLPFPDNSIDKIVSINLIEHLIGHENFIFECQRVLKTGGKIALTTANLDFFLHDYFFDKTHVHEYTLSEFKNIVSQYFSIQVIEKSSSMFNYYPFNFATTKFLKPDLLFIGTKK